MASLRRSVSFRPVAFVAVCSVAVIAAAWCGPAGRASAATLTWSGTGANGSWGTAQNWAGAVAPVSGDTLVFAGSTRLTNTNSLAASSTFASITFGTNAGAFQLSGNAISLGLSGGTGGITVSSSNTLQTVGFNMALTGTNNQVISVVPTARLLLTGTLSRSANPTSGQALVLQGGGTMTLSGSYSATNVSMGVANGSTLELNSAAGGIAGRFFQVSSGTVLVTSGTHSWTQSSSSFGNTAGANTANYVQTGGSLTLSTVTMSNQVGTTSNVTITGGTLAATTFNISRGITGGNGTIISLSGTSLLNTGTFQFGDGGTDNPNSINTVTVGAGSEFRATSAFNWGNSGATVRNNTVDVASGTFSTVASIATNAASVATLYLGGGGVLQARGAGTGSLANFLNGVDTVAIKNGGGVIDTNGNSITISQDIGNFAGATTSSLTKNGAGTLTLAGAGSYVGGIVVNTGSVQVGSGGATGSLGSGTVSLAAGTGLVVNRDGSLTLNNAVVGSGGVSFTGPGTVDLGGANTYSGATSISAGRVNVNGSLASNVTVSGSGGIGGEGSTTGSLVFTGASNSLYFDPSTFGSYLTANTVDATGATVTLLPTTTSATTGIVVLQAAGGITGSAGGVGSNFVFTGRGTAYLNGPSGSATQLLFDYAPASLVWTGTDSGAQTIWNTDSVPNFEASGTSEKFFAGDAVTFNDSASSFNVVAQTVSPGSVSFANATNAYSVSGTITGVGGLTKTGGGLLTLAGNHSYAGATAVNGGTVSLQGGLAGSAISVAAGGTLTQTPGSVISGGLGSVTTSGTTTLSGSNTFLGTTTLNAGVLRAESNAQALGAGSLTLAGGELQLAGDTGVSFGRPTTVTGNATIRSDVATSGSAGVTHTLGALSIGGNTLSIASGAAVSGGSPAVAFSSVTLTGNPTFAVGSGAAVSLGTLSTGGSIATFTGSGSVLQTGVWSGIGGVAMAAGFSGTATLNQANAFSGGLAINGGVVNASVAGGAGAGVATVAAGGTLNLTGGAVAYTTGLAGAGPVNVTLGVGSASTTLNNSNAAYTGTLTVGAGAAAGAGKLQVNTPLGSSATVVVNPHATIYVNSAINQAAAISLGGGDTGESLGQLRIENSGTWSGPVTLAGTITGAGDSAVGSSGTSAGFITGPIGETGGARGLSKAGAGTIVLSGSNTYSGTTSVLGGGLQIENAASLGASPVVDIAATGNSALLLGNNVTAGAGKSITIRGGGAGGFYGALSTGAANTGTSTWEGGVVIGATTNTRVGSQAGLLRIAGPITEAAAGSALAVRNNTGTTAITNGSNSFSGGTNLVVGTLLIGADGVKSGASIVSGPLGTGTFTYGSAGNTVTISSDSAVSRTIVNPMVLSGTLANVPFGDGVNTGKLTFAGDVDIAGIARTFTTNADTQIDGVLSSSTAGTYVLTKAGAGTLTLTNPANANIGNVTISLGALRITNAGALGTGAKTITINAGANKWLELDGSGGAITLGPSISYTTSGINGVIRNVGGNNVVQGTITMSLGNGDSRVFSDAGTLSLTGTVTASTSTRVLDLSGSSSGTNTFSGVLTNASTPSLKKSGATTWIVSGSNLFAGGVAVTDGVLDAASTGALGVFTGAKTLSLDGGTLRYSAGTNFTQDNAAIAVGGNTTIEAATAGVSFRAGGALTGTSSGNLTIAGPGIVALGRNSAVTLGSTYAGAITVASGGTLDVRNPDSLGDAAGTTTVQSGGTLLVNPFNQPNGVTFNAEPLVFNGASRLRNWNQAVSGTTTNTLTGPIAANGLLTITNTTSGGAARLAISGAISGTGAVTFGGANEAGTYVLSGSNTYTGLTRIDAGRVQIAAGGSVDATSGFVVGTSTSIDAVLDLTQRGAQVSFGPGQTISGKGTIELAAGAVLSIPGLLSPGNSPGNLSIVAGLAWRSTDAGYVWEINDATGTEGTASSGWDLVTLTGTLDLTALTSSNRYSLDLATLTSGNVAGPMANYVDGGSYRWSLVNSAGGVLLLSGTAAADTDVTDLFNVSFANWQNPAPAAGNYSVRVANDGLGLDFVVVPEPGSLAFVGITLAGAALAIRRRRR